MMAIPATSRLGAAATGKAKARTLARELIGRTPDALVPSTNQVTRIVQQETRTIPIVFAFVGDPVGSGFVASLARPGRQTAVINSIRAHLAEFGIVAPVGRKGVTELLHVVADPSDKRVPEVARACLAALGNQLLSLKEQIVEFDRMIMVWHRSNETSKPLSLRVRKRMNPLSASNHRARASKSSGSFADATSLAASGLLQYGGDFVDGAIGDILDVLDLKEISRLGWRCALLLRFSAGGVLKTRDLLIGAGDPSRD
jgi:ABC transporter substrate binding protein